MLSAKVLSYMSGMQCKATCLTVSPTPAQKMAIEKTWALAQGRQMTMLKHHLPKEVDFTVCTKRCY